MKKVLLTAALLGATMFGTSALALTAEQVVEREVIVKNLDGTETVKREKADKVVPGEKIVYSINYYNDLDKSADNVVLVMPVPAELTYIEGSADADGTRTAYSADGGKTFAARQEVTIKTAEDSIRTAESADITHVKWIVSSIMPGEQGTLSFKGELK